MPTKKPHKRSYRMTARADAAAATGERLLAAAWEHFSSRPYEEVRLQDVASDAGVTVQTLYQRFGSKDDLLTEAYKWWGKKEIAARDAAQVGDVPGAVGVSLHTMKHTVSPSSECCLKRIDCRPFDI